MFLLQVHNAARALHGRGANFAFGHSCELESSPSGDWVGGLRSASRGRWERVGLISDLIRRSLPRRMALGVVAV